MSRFKTAAITPFQTRKVFKRKGNRVRYIDPVTAQVSGWECRPKTLTVTDAPSERALAHSVLKDMTVAELRDLAKGRGVKVLSKARKADIIAALTGN